MPDLDDLTKLLKDESLSDLDWLDVGEKEYRELETLPKQNLDSIPDLEKQWKTLTEADKYRLSPENREPSAPNTPFWSERRINHLSDEWKVDVVEQFTRRHLMAGASAKEASLLLKKRFDKDTLAQAKPQIKMAFQERGLLGNVYVDSGLFPKCDQGQGQDFVKRHNKTAKFVLAKDKCDGCVWKKEGRCSRFQKELVFDVQYNDNLWEFYKNKAEALGKNVEDIEQKKVSNKEKIRLASMAVASEGPEALDSKPVQVNPADTIGKEAAFSEVKSAEIQREVVENVYRSKKINHIAQRMMAGDHSEQVRDVIASDPDLEPLEKHLYVLGNLYKASFPFKTEDELEAFENKHASINSLPEFTSVEDFYSRPEVRREVVKRAALVKGLSPTEDKKAFVDFASDKLKKLSSISPQGLRKVAQNVFSRILPEDTKKYAGTSFTTKEAQVANTEVSADDLESFKTRVTNQKPQKAKRDLKYYLKKEGGRDLLALLKSRLGLDTVKSLWLGKSKTSSSVQDVAKKDQKRKKVLATVVGDQFDPQGESVLMPEFFHTKMGKWLRDRMLAGSTGAKLSREIKKAFSEEDILENAPMILAMREEEGLLGRVYSPADAFDDCAVGKRAMNATVNQVVKGDKCSGCIYNKTSKCLLYGKSLVDSPRYSDQEVQKALAHRVSSGELTKRDAQDILQRTSSTKERVRTAHRASTNTEARMSDSSYTAFRGESDIQMAKAEKKVGQMLKQAREWLLEGHDADEVRKAAKEEFGDRVVKLGSVYLDQIIDRTHDYISEVVDQRNIEAATGLDQMEDLELTSSKVSNVLDNIDLTQEEKKKPLDGVTFNGFTLSE